MAVQRFVLNSTALDNAGFGLDGGAAFILDSSVLDGDRVLDGGQFLTVATASSSLGGIASTSTATVVKAAVASSTFGGLTASAQAQARKADAVAVASLGGLDASATTKVVKDVVAVASLGVLAASATTKVAKSAIAVADLGRLDGAASAQSSPPAPPPVDDGVGYLPPYPQRPIRRKPKPVEVLVEINEPRKPRLVSAVGSTMLGGAVVAATGLVAFSILDDDAEVLLLI